MSMPVRERHGHLYRLMNENKKKQEVVEQMSSNNGKKTISGDALVQKMKSGEVN